MYEELHLLILKKVCKTVFFRNYPKGDEMQTVEEHHTKWLKIIEEQKTSGLSKAAFCKGKGIKDNQFYYYADKLNQPKAKKFSNVENFVPIEIKPSRFVSSAPEPASLRIILKNGIECVLADRVSSQRIREVVEVLLQC